jgi:hypothetical protein
MPAIVTRFETKITRLDNRRSSSTFPSQSPLVFWRTRRPDQMHSIDAASVRMALAGTRISGECRWEDAITGDGDGYAAVAIGICVRQMKTHPVDAAEVELAVSATLAYALLGDAASAVAMAWALRHRAKIDPRCSLLSDLWLASDF